VATVRVESPGPGQPTPCKQRALDSAHLQDSWASLGWRGRQTQVHKLGQLDFLGRPPNPDNPVTWRLAGLPASEGRGQGSVPEIWGPQKPLFLPIPPPVPHTNLLYPRFGDAQVCPSFDD
jgi:hypothetical protein